jgi:hypothetical protein
MGKSRAHVERPANIPLPNEAYTVPITEEELQRAKLSSTNAGRRTVFDRARLDSIDVNRLTS